MNHDVLIHDHDHDAVFFFAFECKFFLKMFAFEILEIELKCKIFEKIMEKSLGIASKLKENGSEEGKNAKFSACGELGSKKGF